MCRLIDDAFALSIEGLRTTPTDAALMEQERAAMSEGADRMNAAWDQL